MHKEVIQNQAREVTQEKFSCRNYDHVHKARRIICEEIMYEETKQNHVREKA